MNIKIYLINISCLARRCNNYWNDIQYTRHSKYIDDISDMICDYL